MRNIIVGTLALLAFGTVPVLAQCRSRVVVAVQHKAAVVQVVTPVVTAAVYVPAYSASYNGEAAGVIAELRKLREELRQGHQQKAEPLSFAALVNARCASCHQDGKENQGGGFVMVEKDGTIPPFSLAERRGIERAVKEGRMPPKNPLQANEAKAFLDGFAKKE